MESDPEWPDSDSDSDASPTKIGDITEAIATETRFSGCDVEQVENGNTCTLQTTFSPLTCLNVEIAGIVKLK